MELKAEVACGSGVLKRILEVKMKIGAEVRLSAFIHYT